jgi:hypothetical protein
LDLLRQILPLIVILTGSGLRPPNSDALSRECEVMIVKAQTTWPICVQLLPVVMVGGNGLDDINDRPRYKYMYGSWVPKSARYGRA